jgi:glycosyltransferase involved in cell wall biosynthesis
MRIIAFVIDVSTILAHLGEPTAALEVAPARSPSPWEQAAQSHWVAAIDNPVDLEQIPDVQRARRVSRKPRVVTLGRSAPQKAPDLFTEMAKRVSGDVAAFGWIGAGTPEAETALRDVPNVTLTGWVSRDEALARLVEADAYLQTSRWEGTPFPSSRRWRPDCPRW